MYLRNKADKVALAGLLLLPVFSAWAFLPPTHAVMTNAAWSLLPNRDSIIARLGLKDLPPEKGPVFGQKYYDFDPTNTTVSSRNAANGDYEAAMVESGKPTGIGLQRDFSLTLPGWLLRGAIREDDNPAEEKTPRDDPNVKGGSFHREFNHFYDPAHDQPLTVLNGAAVGLVYFTEAGTTTIRKTPDWAASTDNLFNNPNQRGSDRLNRYTLVHAKEALWRAVTGKSFVDDNPITPDGGPANEETRKAYWATTFRALGNVLHLLQDMGQPQHTRNEPHTGIGSTKGLQNNLLGQDSVIENYLDARARGEPSFAIDGTKVAAAPLPMTGYEMPCHQPPPILADRPPERTRP